MSSLEALTGSGSLSYSSLDSLLTCGEKYRLIKVVGVKEQDAWYLLGGSAVHEATELLDKGEEEDPIRAWDIAWTKQLQTVEDRNNVRAAGRATKANPNKEDQGWWEANGPLQVQNYLEWRIARQQAGWELLHTEVAFNVTLGDTPVRGYIDRVFVTDAGEVVVVDLKTGSRAPASTVQLGVYRQGLKIQHGLDVHLGAYLMTRQAEKAHMPPLHGLTHYTDEMLGRWFDKAKGIIEQDLLVPHVGPLCGSCTVAPHCEAVGGTPPVTTRK